MGMDAEYRKVLKERFGDVAADLEHGITTCSNCGGKLLYGRHLRGDLCVPCTECKRIGLEARFPCSHDIFRSVEVNDDPLGAELPVWGL
jgi:hypothetical protein